MQSARIMSFTPGSSTIELMGRFWRAPFQRQQPYVLDRYEAVCQRGRPDEATRDHVRVCHENVHAVFRVLLILTLCFQDKPLENVIVPGDNAAPVY